MEEVTNASEVIDFFESSFADKEVIPFELEEIQKLGDRFIDGVPISYIMDNSKEGILYERVLSRT